MIVSLDKMIAQAYAVIGRGQKLRPQQVSDAIDLLDVMFKSWSNKGHDLWRVSKFTLPIGPNFPVLYEDTLYLCNRDHISSADDSPDISGPFWTALPSTYEDEFAEEWESGRQYQADFFLPLIQENIFTVGNVRVFEGNKSVRFRMLNRATFDSIDELSIGTPTRGKYIPKSIEDGYPRIYLDACPSDRNVNASIDIIKHADSGFGLSMIPENWFSAMKYGLAVELGYHNSIDSTSLTGIVNKFQFEFRRARGSEKEVVSSCFVESLF